MLLLQRPRYWQLWLASVQRSKANVCLLAANRLEQSGGARKRLWAVAALEEQPA